MPALFKLFCIYSDIFQILLALVSIILNDKMTGGVLFTKHLPLGLQERIIQVELRNFYLHLNLYIFYKTNIFKKLA